MRKKVLRLISLILVSVALSACQLLPEEEVLPPMPVIHDYEVEEYELVTVMRGDLISTATVRPTYKLTRKQHLSFSLGGLYIDSVYIIEGQAVKTGDLLASLEQKELQSQLAAQRHEVNVLYAEGKHLKETLDLELAEYSAMLTGLEQELQQKQAALQESVSTGEDAPSTQELQQQIDSLLQQKQALERKIASAQSSYDAKLQPVNDSMYIEYMRLQELESTVSDRQLVAGIDGVITFLRDVEDGQRSVKGENFITISNLDSAAFITDTEYAEYFPLGTEVVITCSGKDYEALVVDATELGFPTVDATEPTTIYFKLKQPDPSLMDNARGAITLTLDQRTNALYVHKKAIQTTNGETFVYLLDENGLRTMRSVTIGMNAGNFVEIIEGLNEGDRVIVE